MAGPYLSLLGIEAHNGRATLRVDERHSGHMRVGHAGAAIGLVEAAALSLFYEELPVCLSWATKMIRPAWHGDELVAGATLVRRTRSLAFVMVSVKSSQGQILLADLVFEFGTSA